MDRIDLLNQIYAGRTLLESQLARLDAERMNDPVLPGGWSAKDMLAHLGWWERRSVEIYQELTAGGDPARPVTPAEVDIVNAQVLSELRPHSLDWVREFEHNAYRDLLHLVETMPEEDLFDAQRFAWTGGYPFSEWILGNSCGHYDEHLPDLHPLMGDAPIRVAGGKAPSTGGLVDPVGIAADLARMAAVAPDTSSLNPVVQRGRAFLRREGRDIDMALFNFCFGSLDTGGVLEVLARYQNPDGGFARLEFDIEAPQSNPFACELALVILNWINPPRDHPVVRRLVEYLERTQEDDGCWRLPPEAYEHTLAAWYKSWEWPNISPSCSISGLLKRLDLGSEKLHARIMELFEKLANPADLTGSEFYAARPYAYYLAANVNPTQADLYRWGVVWWLVRGSLVGPLIDATHFMELAGVSDSPISKQIPPKVLSTQLDRLLEGQSADGGWPTPYSARWRSWITINNLLFLRSYRRV